MINLRSPLKIEPDTQGRWQLILCAGNAFDYTTPFRALLGDIAEALGQDSQNDLQLPPYEEGEDFVEGTLRFGSTTLRIYYEHSLSYLALTSDSEGTLRNVADRIVATANDSEEAIYHAVPGGADLVRWFGQVPSFHDAEILSLHLCRKGQSTLCVLGWINTGEVGPNGYYVLDRHAVVTFVLTDVMDLQLDGFSQQNVIAGLVLRRAPDRADRRAYLALAPHPQDIEIELELEPCYGLDGFIRARSVAITFEPGKPTAQDY
jgi:immunity protein 50 of polymorphic toxin system